MTKKSKVEELKKQEAPSECDYCFEDDKEFLWDEETAMWVCTDCAKELQDERDLMQAVDERPIEYYDKERYDNDEG